MPETVAPPSRPPFPDDLGVRGPTPRLKRWQFFGLSGADAFVGLGLVHLGYLSQVFAFVAAAGEAERHRYEKLSLLGRGLEAPARPDAGGFRFRGGPKEHVRVEASETGWQLSLSLPLRRGRARTRLDGTLHVDRGQGLSLHFELDPGRHAYTYKVADTPVEGALSLGGEALGGPLRACVDWTRSYARRHTRWRWACGTGEAHDGTRLGLNLSQHVYDREGKSAENALWVDGELQAVGHVSLQRPDDPMRASWQLEGEQVQLRFHPDGGRHDRVELGVLRSRFVQASGHYEGHVAGRRVRHLYGLMEDHDALW